MTDIFGIKRIRAEYSYLFALVIGLCAILRSPDDVTVAKINNIIEQKREELR